MSETAAAHYQSPMRDCRCCNNTRTVETALGERRPCSRCSATAFDAWYDERRKERLPAPTAKGEDDGTAG